MTNVSLGNGITGKKGGALHQISYLWTEGRWTLLVITGENGSVKGYTNGFAKTLAENIVSYLHTHMLGGNQSYIIGLNKTYAMKPVGDK